MRLDLSAFREAAQLIAGQRKEGRAKARRDEALAKSARARREAASFAGGAPLEAAKPDTAKAGLAALAAGLARLAGGRQRDVLPILARTLDGLRQQADRDAQAAQRRAMASLEKRRAESLADAESARAEAAAAQNDADDEGSTWRAAQARMTAESRWQKSARAREEESARDDRKAEAKTEAKAAVGEGQLPERAKPRFRSLVQAGIDADDAWNEAMTGEAARLEQAMDEGRLDPVFLADLQLQTGSLQRMAKGKAFASAALSARLAVLERRILLGQGRRGRRWGDAASDDDRLGRALDDDDQVQFLLSKADRDGDEQARGLAGRIRSIDSQMSALYDELRRALARPEGTTLDRQDKVAKELSRLRLARVNRLTELGRLLDTAPLPIDERLLAPISPSLIGPIRGKGAPKR